MARHFRKSIVVALAAMLGLAACSGGGEEGKALPTDSPDKVQGKVLFWTYPLGKTGEDSYWKPVVERFNETYPEVEVEVVIQPFKGREQALTTSVAGGKAPDVVYFNPDFVPRFAEDGLLEPVGDVIEASKDDFTESTLQSMTYDGELYGVPWLVTAQSVLCIKDVIEKAGIECPTTFDEVLAAAPKVKEAGFYVMQHEGAIEVTLNGSFYQFLRSAGGEVLNEDGTEAAFNGPEGLRALEFLTELAKNDYLPQQSLTQLLPFEQTAAAKKQVALLPANNFGAVSAFIDPDQLIVSSPLKDKSISTYGTIGGLSVFGTSKNIPAAKAWVNFLTSEEEMKEFLGNTNFFAPRKSVTGLHEDNPQLVEQSKYIDVMWTGVAHPKAREIMGVIAPHIQAALLGKEEPQAALDAAADEVNALIKR